MSSKYFKIYGGIKTAAEAGKKILTTSKAYKNKLQADKVTAAKDKGWIYIFNTYNSNW